MTTNLLSGSRIAIAKECGWGFHKDSSYTPAPSGEAAADGTLVHERLAGDPKPIRPELALVANYGKQWMGERTVIANERTYAYRPSDRTARVLGDNLDRKYLEAGLDAENEIPITVDVVGRTTSGEFFVVDWKTGRPEYVEPADTNLQIGLGAYCVAYCHQARRVYGTLVFLSLAGATEDTAEYGGVNFMRVLGLVEQAWMNTKRKSTPQPGDHCRWCPALGACPATREQFGEVLESKCVWTTDFVSSENDAQLAMNIPAMEKALEAIKDSLKTRAPIQLPNGKVWKAIVVKQTRLDNAKVAELIGERLGECQKTVEFEQYRQVKN